MILKNFLLPPKTLRTREKAEKREQTSAALHTKEVFSLRRRVLLSEVYTDVRVCDAQH